MIGGLPAFPKTLLVGVAIILGTLGADHIYRTVRVQQAREPFASAGYEVEKCYDDSRYRGNLRPWIEALCVSRARSARPLTPGEGFQDANERFVGRVERGRSFFGSPEFLYVADDPTAKKIAESLGMELDLWEDIKY